ncbi:Bro-N domain-containing protein [Pseudomonas petrae]|uniref:Bro-N domain-containing protein n=1 Tax=Pseudomonas petrae TaxID=2912190 RepID=A0ABS9IEA2_9PSED|nr:Bro-N domain-containing protein [Pseudomonas petrae]MCF7537568.1 Bro-N domain-containing protein [Pseudomonas petrae]MCF7545626.1 Bro-N domain-containing protein [Pseudomonas petrae]
MNLVPFNFNGSEIRLITDDQGEPWFIARDVADLLEYANPHEAVRTHCKGVRETLIPSAGGEQMTKVIPERDIYRLVMRSRMPAAEAFEEWVVGEVLPTIRKTGSYQRPMTQAEMIVASANILVSLERQQAQQQVDLVRVERKVEDMERFHVWDHRPSNCLSLTGVKAEMNKRYGLSGAVVDYVLKDWPHLPNPAGMVRNGHEEALESQYMVWAKTVVTTAFKRFVSECQMETATQASHPYFEGRFRLVQQVQS